LTYKETSVKIYTTYLFIFFILEGGGVSLVNMIEPGITVLKLFSMNFVLIFKKKTSQSKSYRVYNVWVCVQNLFSKVLWPQNQFPRPIKLTFTI